MEIRIQAIHFDASQKLEEFINRKAERLARRFASISLIDVTLKVVKPETAMNKEAIVKAVVPQQDDMVADKTADTFEEAIDMCLEAIERQLEKVKGRK
ncbi:MAG: HPF/RaiA family ribosome-associated protein [Muribaculaceae bacterium]|nr:HPF/RaiA family ribosome-associated protein [Muribaculaceae bacterium]